MAHFYIFFIFNVANLPHPTYTRLLWQVIHHGDYICLSTWLYLTWYGKYPYI
jgi:hypothetical protein